MNKELFGVFGDADEFEQFRAPVEFDRVVEGGSLTVGIRDIGLGIPDWSTVAQDGGDFAAIWGEVYLPERVVSPAEWLLDAYGEHGPEALSALNGSYVAAVDVGGDAAVATDTARTWECFYTDDPGVRLFGTDPLAVMDAVASPTVERDPLLEFLLLGQVLGDRTVFSEVSRISFDGLIRANSTEALERFVYDRKEFDYATELARRLKRAIRRRAHLPGSSAVMLSGGYDSRTILACLPEVDVTYTIGERDCPELTVAARVADQYGVPHQPVYVDGKYLNTRPETIRYGQGIKESLHAHQAGYESQMDVDTVYHGLLCDTYLRGHFQPRDSVKLFGYDVPRNRLDPDPDPVEALLSKYGYFSGDELVFERSASLPDDPREFARDAIESNAPEAFRCDSTYDWISLFGIANQPTTPFRIHLSDQYLESFVAADAELLDWHLSTPPEHRNDRTFLRAIRKIDPDILRHRPPDRPYDSHPLNQAERLVRRTVPGLRPFTHSWPDRRTHYERRDLDAELFPADRIVHDLPPRVKLRVNEVTNWINRAGGDLTPTEVVRPVW